MNLDIKERIGSLMRPWLRARLRSAMRAHRRLKELDRLDVLPKLMNALTIQPLNRPAGKLSDWIFGAASSSGEISLRQYLLLRLAGPKFNLSLLASLVSPNARVIYPLPSDWQKTLVAHRFRVARFYCTMLWCGYVLLIFFYGLAQSICILLSALKLTKNESYQSPYAYFLGLTEGNLPRSAGAVEGYWNVINWYFQWSDRPTTIREFRHGVQSAKPMCRGEVPIILQKKSIPPLRLGAIPAYLVWLIGALVISVADMIRGRWWHPLMLNEAALAAQARVSSESQLAKQYLFHNSGWLYRPLWTFELPAKGSECLLYFYSTNCEGVAKKGKRPFLYYGYESMNWPHYIVWDKCQAQFVRRVANGSYDISIVGEVWFSDAPIEVPSYTKPMLALFDITPHRASRYRSLGLDDDFHVPEVAVPLVEDVICSAAQLKVTVAWKRKRNVGKTAHPRYRNFAEKCATNSNVKIVDADIAASELIARSDLVISAPFTSTAILARNAGRPSAYYDPLGMLDRLDPGAHGIPILAGPKELLIWMQENLPSSISKP